MSIQISEFQNPLLQQANNFTYDTSSNQFIYINSHSLQTAKISQLNPNLFEQNNQIQGESHSSNVGQQTNVAQHRNLAQNSNQQQQQIGQENQIKENKNQNLQIPEEYKKRDEHDRSQEQQTEEQKEIVATESSTTAKKEQTGLSAYLNTLRFSKLKSSQSGVSISPSGLTVTCKASQSTHYVLCGTVFPREGSFYFELIFPNGCEDACQSSKSLIIEDSPYYIQVIRSEKIINEIKESFQSYKQNIKIIQILFDVLQLKYVARNILYLSNLLEIQYLQKIFNRQYK